jgi:hypothetical protein
VTFHDFSKPVAVALVPEHKARMIREGITRNEYRSRFGLDEAAERFFNRVESERKLADRVASGEQKPEPKPKPVLPPVPAFTGYKPNETSYKARVLAQLAHDGIPLTARQIADRMGLEIRQVQRALSTLVLINKVRSFKIENKQNYIKAYQIIKKVEPTKPERLISDLYPTVKDIQAEVAEEFGITLAAMFRQNRSQTYAFARFAAIYLCRELKPNMSYPDLSDRFGYRDHTSVLSADRRARQFMTDRPDFGDKVRKVWARIVEKTARGRK